MLENNRTLIPNKTFQSEIEEKKSKFISYAKYVQSKEEINDFILSISAEHQKARHICYAYKYIENGQLYQKSNDDGEPSGTAGKPILNIIEKNELINVCIIVVRYFGGVKLGAGNLLRTYSNSAKECLVDAITDFSISDIVKIKISYSNYAKVISIFSQNNINYELKQENENAVFEIDLQYKEKAENLLQNYNIPFESEVAQQTKID